MNPTNCDTLIIGAGITGLSLASFLDTDDYLIVEKDSEVGGYCKTTIKNGSPITAKIKQEPLPFQHEK